VRDHKLAYPVRYGARTVHLTESEVADRYRCRFAQARERAERLDEVIAGGQAVFDPDQAWLTVAVVPEVAGTVPIDHAALERLTRWVRSLPKFPLGGTWRYELGNPGGPSGGSGSARPPGNCWSPSPRWWRPEPPIFVSPRRCWGALLTTTATGAGPLSSGPGGVCGPAGTPDRLPPWRRRLFPQSAPRDVSWCRRVPCRGAGQAVRDQAMTADRAADASCRTIR
jgi:hypothetical protein